MPYRLKPSDKTVVQIERNGKWEDLKAHPSVTAATKHLVALRMNVEKVRITKTTPTGGSGSS